MNLPEPKSIRISLFGHEAILSERTAEERFQLEDAMANRNGASSFDYIISLKAIECALQQNVVPLPSWFRPIERRKTASKNKAFRISNLRDRLSWTQIEFILNELGKLEWGDAYDEIKKKAQKVAVKASPAKPSKDS